MRTVTFISAYYENPGMLRRHYRSFAAFPKDICSQFRIIIVDDGSPMSPAFAPEEKIGVPVSIYRMLVDVRWNQDACRNLGASQADGWLLLTDIDHMVPLLTATRLVNGEFDDETEFDESVAYRFSRVSEPTMNPYPPHPNSWFMTRELFDAAGGYDERFAGYYGTDGPFRDSVSAIAPIVQLSCPLVRIPREVTPDASTTTYKRKTPEDTINIQRIKSERASIPNWKPLRLTFPWERVV